ncbi:MAG: phasin family protein [Alphaproteobacteria bacterium]|mgnify:CR=1 FL=1|nr:phasin family protein [Alphaproteobacteria bacterium]
MARKGGEGTPTDSTADAAVSAFPAAAGTAEAVAAAAGPVGAAAEAGINQAGSEVKANMEKAMKTAEEMVSFGQGNVEAIVKSGQIWAAGVQDISKQVAASAQAQVDYTVATMKALAGVKSFKEAIDLQSSLARSSLEKVVAETGKLTDASLKLAEQTLAPLTARVTLAMEKFGRPV